MNRKQLVILFLLVVALGGAALLMRKKGSSMYEDSGEGMGKKLLGDFPVNDVSRLVFKQGPATLNLVKTNDLWRVRERDNYPANYSDISEFLLKVRDLKVVQSEKVGPSQLSRLDLVAGAGTNSALAVEFRDASDKVLRTLLLGKKHMRKSARPSPMGEMGGEDGFPDGRYVKALADSDSVALISEALANIEPKPEAWLNKEFIKVDRVKAISFSGPPSTNAWKVTRDTEAAEWKLADAKKGEQLDASKVSSMANQLSSPSFNDVAPIGRAGEFGLNKPGLLTLETFDNFTYAFKIGAKTNDNMSLTFTLSGQVSRERVPGKDEKPEDKTKLDKEFGEKQKKLEEKLTEEKRFEPWVFLVSSWTLEPFLKDRGQLMAEKKEDPAKATDGGGTNTLSNTLKLPGDDDTNNVIPPAPALIPPTNNTSVTLTNKPAESPKPAQP
jgi:hypothetical protein